MLKCLLALNNFFITFYRVYWSRSTSKHPSSIKGLDQIPICMFMLVWFFYMLLCVLFLRSISCDAMFRCFMLMSMISSFDPCLYAYIQLLSSLPYFTCFFPVQKVFVCHFVPILSCLVAFFPFGSLFRCNHVGEKILMMLACLFPASLSLAQFCMLELLLLAFYVPYDMISFALVTILQIDDVKCLTPSPPILSFCLRLQFTLINSKTLESVLS